MISEKKNKGLGRGLMSLFGDQDIQEIKMDIKSQNSSISIGNLSRGKFQPRKVFNEEKINELATSIKNNGLIQPIVVRPDPRTQGFYEIVAGERRWLAAQKAGLHEIPVVILNLDDNQSLEVAIVENIQREDLNALEEARGYEKLTKEFSYDHDKLSKFMGKSRSHISNTLRLLALPDDVLNLIENGKLTAGQVRPLIGRYNASQLARNIITDRLSARSVENLVKREKIIEENRLKPRSTTDPNILLAQRHIEENLGLKVTITNKKNNSGKIVVEYKNLEQFDYVAKLLKHK